MNLNELKIIITKKGRNEQIKHRNAKHQGTRTTPRVRSKRGKMIVTQTDLTLGQKVQLVLLSGVQENP